MNACEMPHDKIAASTSFKFCPHCGADLDAVRRRPRPNPDEFIAQIVTVPRCQHDHGPWSGRCLLDGRYLIVTDVIRNRPIFQWVCETCRHHPDYDEGFILDSRTNVTGAAKALDAALDALILSDVRRQQ